MSGAVWRASPRRRVLAELVVHSPLTGAFEFPQALAKPPGNVREILPTKEKQGEKEN
jgi:hypothetical protein